MQKVNCNKVIIYLFVVVTYASICLFTLSLICRFENIVELRADSSGQQLRLQTRQGLQVVLQTEHAEQIRALVEKLMTGSGGKVYLSVYLFIRLFVLLSRS